jgi:hypothetical protein
MDEAEPTKRCVELVVNHGKRCTLHDVPSFRPVPFAAAALGRSGHRHPILPFDRPSSSAQSLARAERTQAPKLRERSCTGRGTGDVRWPFTPGPQPTAAAVVLRRPVHKANARSCPCCLTSIFFWVTKITPEPTPT